MELPKEFKGTIYFYHNVVFDYTVAYQSETDGDPDLLLMGTLDVDVAFDVTHEQAVNQLVTNLNKQKKTIQAKAQQELNQVDEKINSLLAITHEVES